MPQSPSSRLGSLRGAATDRANWAAGAADNREQDAGDDREEENEPGTDLRDLAAKAQLVLCDQYEAVASDHIGDRAHSSVAGGDEAMRLIYAFLALRMIRLARFDLTRSERLYRDGAEAFERSRERVRLADAWAVRAELPSRASLR